MCLGTGLGRCSELPEGSGRRWFGRRWFSGGAAVLPNPRPYALSPAVGWGLSCPPSCDPCSGGRAGASSFLDCSWSRRGCKGSAGCGGCILAFLAGILDSWVDLGAPEGARPYPPQPLVCLWPQRWLPPAPGWLTFLAHAPPPARSALPTPTLGTRPSNPPSGAWSCCSASQASPTHPLLSRALPVFPGCSASLGNLSSKYAEHRPCGAGLGWVLGVRRASASPGYWHRCSRLGGLTAGVYCLAVQRLEVQDQGVTGLVPPEAVREKLLQGLSWLLGVAGDPWGSLVCSLWVCRYE